jgi:hypothetical protein
MISATAVHHRKTLDHGTVGTFDVFAYRTSPVSRSGDTIWLVVIMVDRDLNVFATEEEGDVPYELLECALGGP